MQDPTKSGKQCECPEGFEGDGLTCKDIDECADPRRTVCSCSDCHCTNTYGSYDCSCGSSNLVYLKDSDQCISECKRRAGWTAEGLVTCAAMTAAVQVASRLIKSFTLIRLSQFRHHILTCGTEPVNDYQRFRSSENLMCVSCYSMRVNLGSQCELVSLIVARLLPGSSQAGSSPRVAGMIVGIVLGAVLLILVVGYAIYKYRLRVSAQLSCVD